MVFSSFTFLLLFLPLAVLSNLACRSIRAKNVTLCAFSLVFYAWGEPVYILLMLFSILFNYLVGLGMARFPARKGLLLFLAAAVNVGIIVYFKYLDLLLTAWNSLTGARIPPAGIALPIGISFYTFQILSYVVDVYRGRIEPQRNLVSLAVYISMFPQLVAGPIVRYETVCAQLKDRRVTAEAFAEGLSRMVIGLGKKVLLANQMALAADAVFRPDSGASGGVLWIGAICYSLQIYFDFSGYSDMAIGIGRMFGFNFPENFNEPYLADSITDFWRRWHISLSSWFREYVYIPLGGNRRGPARQIFNLLVVWILTGLWHGASWNFALWGLYYGMLLILEKFLLKNALRRLPSIIRHLLTLLLVLFGWILFRVENPDALGMVLREMLSFRTGGTARWFLANADALRALAALPAAVAACLPIRRFLLSRFGERIRLSGAARVWALLVLLLSLAMLLGESYNPFIYFRF